MKILRHLISFLLVVNWGCTVTDPEIPEGHNFYEKGGEPKARASVQELSQNSVILKMDIESTGGRKLTRFCACYSETNPLPDTTDWVTDLIMQYQPDTEELLIPLSNLEPATSYYCRLYLANPDNGSYTNSVVFSTKVPSDNFSWQKVASIPWTSELYLTGFNAGNRFFAVASCSSSADGNNLIEYLPETDAWVKRSVLPFDRRMEPVAVSAGGKGYVGLGNIEMVDEEGFYRYYSQRDWWCYDPEADEWERKADIPVSTTAMMAAFGIGDKVYVLTSTDYWNSTPMMVLVYDTQLNIWTRKNDFPGDKLQHAASFVIDGRPFVFTGTTSRMEEGGNVDDNESEYTSNMWEYEVATDSWFRCSDFKGGGRSWMVAAALDGKGYAGFGYKPVTDKYQTSVVDWWMYDQKQDSWSRKSVLTEWLNIQPLLAFSLGGYIYIGSVYDGFWKYVGDK